jgi:uncharacterized protein YcbK (DUF882 family)
MSELGYPTESRYSLHFTKAELNCKCGCKPTMLIQKNLTRLAEELEKLRHVIGLPVQITSGYRCEAYNHLCGGAPLSQHMSGLAADIWVRGKTPAQVKAAAEKVLGFRVGGIGLYRGWIHVDLRTGGPVRWRG